MSFFIPRQGLMPSSPLREFLCYLKITDDYSNVLLIYLPHVKMETEEDFYPI